MNPHKSLHKCEYSIKESRTDVIVSKSIVDAIKHDNFQLYRAYPAGVISKNGQITTQKNNVSRKWHAKKKKNKCVMFNNFTVNRLKNVWFTPM